MFKPYSNDDDVLNIQGDALTLTNGTTRVVLNGTLELTQDQRGTEGGAGTEGSGGCDCRELAGASQSAREGKRRTRCETGRRRESVSVTLDNALNAAAFV